MGCSTYLVNVIEKRALGAILLKNLLCQLLKTSQLILSLTDNPLQGTQLSFGGTLVQQVNVDVLWEGELALVDGLEQSRLSAAVLTQETVSSAVVDLEG